MSHYLEGDGEGTVFLLYKKKKKSMLASGTNSLEREKLKETARVRWK